MVVSGRASLPLRPASERDSQIQRRPLARDRRAPNRANPSAGTASRRLLDRGTRSAPFLARAGPRRPGLGFHCRSSACTRRPAGAGSPSMSRPCTAAYGPTARLPEPRSGSGVHGGAERRDQLEGPRSAKAGHRPKMPQTTLSADDTPSGDVLPPCSLRAAHDGLADVAASASARQLQHGRSAGAHRARTAAGPISRAPGRRARRPTSEGDRTAPAVDAGHDAARPPTRFEPLQRRAVLRRTDSSARSRAAAPLPAASHS